MSLSLAKKSIRSFDLADAPKDKIKKKTTPKFKSSANLKQQSSQDEKIKKLLLIGTSSIDDNVSKRVSLKTEKRISSWYF